MTADLAAVVLLLAVAAYTCAGGTDYGAGFWDLTAGGAERGKRPRWLIDHAMAPVWEVNNVWLIFIFVIMWTGFPTFFQTVFSALWLPLALAAVGLLLRGAGFAFRKVTRRLAGRRLYGAVFAVASLVTPFFLGAAVGGVASGRVAAGTEAAADAWANPTSLLFGLLAIATTAFLGAVFLSGDARRFEASDLIGYFRRRALASLGVLAVLAVITLFVIADDAPHIRHGLTHGAGLVFVVMAGVAALATAGLLLRTPGTWVRVTAVASRRLRRHRLGNGPASLSDPHLADRGRRGGRVGHPDLAHGRHPGGPGARRPGGRPAVLARRPRRAGSTHRCRPAKSNGPDGDGAAGAG